MTACPSDDLLSRFVHGAVSGEERAAVEVHLDACQSCAELAAQIARTWFTPAGRRTTGRESTALADTERLADGDLPAFPVGDLPVGGRLGRYELGPRIGAGGMGTVYAASDPVLRRSLAVKVIARSATDADDEERLLREARAMARVAHPNVVVVHDAGRTDDGRVFVAMELVRGPSLRRYLTMVPSVRWREVLSLFLDAGRGLVAAHAAGVVHRDFKPENVLVEPSEPARAKVTDFGLACPPPAPDAERGAPASIGRAAWLAQATTRAVVGTPAYMAPEQLDGELSDARADQFAFCLALYEALWKGRPFASPTLAGRREAMGRGAPPPALGDVPAWVWPIVERGMRERPGDRFATMTALVDALEQGEATRAEWLLTAHVLALIAMGCVHIITCGVIVWSLTLPEASEDAGLSVLVTIAVLLFIFWALAGLPMAFVAAYGVARRRPWAYAVTTLYAAAGVLTGIGTPYGVFALLTLRRPELRAALGRVRRSVPVAAMAASCLPGP